MADTPDIEMNWTFEAPREEVWREWTEPERFADWYGGPDFPIPLETVAMDVREGGKWNLVMIAGPREIHWDGEYIEVNEPERLVFTVSDQPDEDVYDLCTVVLTTWTAIAPRCCSSRVAATCPPRRTSARRRAGPDSSSGSPSDSPPISWAAARRLTSNFETNRRKRMSGRIVVTEFISVDGVIEDPGGAEDFEYGGWSFEYDRGDDGDKFKMDELMDAEVQLLGRVTYEGFADAWPSREGDFADKINKGRKVLVSTTLTDPTWENTTVISENVPDELRKLRDETDGNILVAGSGTLVKTLFENDLVDELRLMVFPTILGSGKRLFPDGIGRIKLNLVEDEGVGTDGVRVQVYQRAD